MVWIKSFYVERSGCVAVGRPSGPKWERFPERRYSLLETSPPTDRLPSPGAGSTAPPSFPSSGSINTQQLCNNDTVAV